MDVDRLAEGEAGGVRLLLLFREGALDLVPGGLRRRQRVVAVADHEQHAALFQLFKGGNDGGGIRQALARDVAAAHVQLGIVQYLQRGALPGAEHAVGGVVVQEHDVRKFHHRRLADLQAGRDALDDGRLGGADEGAALLFKRIRLQIDGDDDARAQRRRLRLALDEDKARLQLAENARIAVGAHGAGDLFHPRGAVFFQIDLGKGQAQGGGSIPHQGFQLPPIGGVGGVLVAGDDRPAIQIDARGRQKHLGRSDTMSVHM